MTLDETQAALTYWQDKAANFEAGQAGAYRQLAAETAALTKANEEIARLAHLHDLDHKLADHWQQKLAAETARAEILRAHLKEHGCDHAV